MSLNNDGSEFYRTIKCVKLLSRNTNNSKEEVIRVVYQGVLNTVAENHHTTPIHVYEEIEKAISYGFENPDPEIRARWSQIGSNGNKPTPEELIAYILANLKVL